MKNYIQKKIMISDDIFIPGLFENNRINPNFNIDELEKLSDSKVFVSKSINEGFPTKKNSLFNLILFSSVKNRELIILLKTVFSNESTVNIEFKELLKIEQERHLSDALTKTCTSLPNFLKDEAFDKAMDALAALRAPVDKYFEHVTVNDSDPKLRENRLRSLKLIVKTMDMVADFSLIENS